MNRVNVDIPNLVKLDGPWRASSSGAPPTLLGVDEDMALSDRGMLPFGGRDAAVSSVSLAWG
ncbi:MAG: hypothetical protein WBX17_06845, partial [Microbacterium sp.]